MIATYSIFHIFYFDSSKPGFCLIETVYHYTLDILKGLEKSVNYVILLYLSNT